MVNSLKELLAMLIIGFITVTICTLGAWYRDGCFTPSAHYNECHQMYRSLLIAERAGTDIYLTLNFWDDTIKCDDVYDMSSTRKLVLPNEIIMRNIRNFEASQREERFISYLLVRTWEQRKYTLNQLGSRFYFPENCN